ncbi:response regulator [bacterium SCSIO 12827]|nr:response regulator [bacterium SCSIO 12827]
MPDIQGLTAFHKGTKALPLSGRFQSDTDFENLSRWIDSRLAGNDEDVLEWHVVLADDDASNRFVLGSLLESSGVTVTTVENGRLALDVIGSKPVDLFLLDINMPEMDGLQTARAIRALPDANADLPLIAITSDVSPKRLAEMRDAGFDVCMEKPVRRDTLFHVILGTLSRRVAV